MRKMLSGNLPMQEDPFREYVQLWKREKFDKPIIILIGGNIGTGKSTFAEVLRQKFVHCNVVPTGIIRSILQTLVSEAKSPELFYHTYDLPKLYDGRKMSTIDKAIQGYEKQTRLVDKGIRSLVKFFESERQISIIEGNHILPSTTKELTKHINIIPVFFKNNDTNLYKETVSSSTHIRKLSKQQFAATKMIHDRIVKVAKKLDLPVFDIKEQSKALAYVGSRLKLLNGNK